MDGKGLTGKCGKVQMYVLLPGAVIDVDLRCDGCRWERVVVSVSQTVDVR